MDRKMDNKKNETIQNLVANSYCFQYFKFQFLKAKPIRIDSDGAKILHTP
jgi:hypothetical protein